METYLYKPGVKIRLWEKVYSFDRDGRLITDDETLQSAIEKSPPFQAGEIMKEVKPLRVAVKIYSTILGGYLWVVQDRERWPHMEGGDVPLYDAQEIRELQEKNPSKEELKAVHEIKKVFKGSTVTDNQNIKETT